MTEREMTPTTPEAMAQWFENWPHVGEVPSDWNRHVAVHLRRLARYESVLRDLGRQGYMTGGIERELLAIAREALEGTDG